MEETAKQAAIDLVLNYVIRGDEPKSLNTLGCACQWYYAEVKRDKIHVYKLWGEPVDYWFPLQKIYDEITPNIPYYRMLKFQLEDYAEQQMNTLIFNT